MVPYTNTDLYHGQDGFNDVSFQDKPDINRVNPEKAWSVFSRISKVIFPVERPVCEAMTLQDDPGEVTLVALGPLTNLAIALLADPQLAGRLKQVFIMGGNTEVSSN